MAAPGRSRRVGRPTPVSVHVDVDKERHTGILRWLANPGGRRPSSYRIYASDEKGFSISDTPFEAVAGVSKELAKARPANFLAEVTTNELAVIGGGLKLPNANRAYYRVVAVDEQGKRSGPSDFAAATGPLIYSQPVVRAKVGVPYRYRLDSIRALGDLRTARGQRQGNHELLGHRCAALRPGAVPAWLEIDPATGLLTGTPGQPGRFKVIVTATLDREIRNVDVSLLSWGVEKELSTSKRRVGVDQQEFTIDVGR